MPYKRKNNRRRRRRRRKDYANYKHQHQRSIVPYKMVRNLPYSDISLPLNATANVNLPVVLVYAAGDLYDPYRSGLGHQPRGFDQIMALYDHFVCLGSKLKINSTLTGASSAPVKMGITLLDDSTTLTTTGYMESPNTVFTVLNQEYPTRSLVGKGYSAKQFLGRSHPLSDPDLKGDASNSPSENAFYHIWCSAETSTDPPEVVTTIELDFAAAFIEPKIPDISNI